MNELTHHGILGMKWGVRRTDAQLSRTRGRPKRDDWSEDAKTASDLKKKKISQMSNAELKKLTERNQLELQYKRINKPAIQKGLATAATLTAAMGTIVALYNAGSKAVSVGKKVVDSLGDYVIKDMMKHM